MLVLLVTSMLTLTSGTQLVKATPVITLRQDGNQTASLGVAGAPQGYSWRQGGFYAPDLKDAVWALGGRSSGFGKEYTPSSGLSAPEIESLKWNFSSPIGWSDFAYVNKDSAELVIGVESAWQGSHSELTGYLLENGGKLVDTVSMGNEMRALTVDVPLSSVHSFATEVETAKLASYIEPNIRYKVDSLPNDPEWSLQWGPQKIAADWAWNTTGGDPSVLVAVVDTGIDYNHPDLAANYVPLGYDWVNNDPNPMDDYGHGTHVAGIIAAAINNSIGIAGLAQVRIMAEKVLDASGSGSSSDVARGIVDAVDQGAKIINLSLGSAFNSELLHEAVKYAYDHGVLVVASAGNDATNAESYPAAYNEVVAVSATDQSDEPAAFTNYGDWVDVAAPGVDILSTMPTYHVTLNDEGYTMNYDFLSGTSMASPHAAGVAALIWSRFPNMTRDQVQAQLQYARAKKAGIESNGKVFGWHLGRKLFLRTCAELGITSWNAQMMCGKAVDKSIATYINGVKLKNDAMKVHNVLRMEVVQTNGNSKNKELLDLMFKVLKDLVQDKLKLEGVTFKGPPNVIEALLKEQRNWKKTLEQLEEVQQ